MEKITINFTDFQFPQITYVSPIGSDSTGDGTKTNPYKTWIKARNETPSGGAVYFLEGEYIFTNPDPQENKIYWKHWMTNLQKPLSIFGVAGKTKIIFDFTNMGTPADDNRNYAMHLPYCNIYHLICEMKNAPSGTPALSKGFLGNFLFDSHASTHVLDSMRLYNCVLIGRNYTGAYDYCFGSSNNSLNNCTIFNLSSEGMSNKGGVYINCEVMNMDFRAQTTNIVRADTIISYENIPSYLEEIPADCLNQGTGLNPDITQAHIGVYGGAYGWGEWPRANYYFIKANNTYYTYNGSAWIDTGVEEPLTKEDYEQYGMESFHDIPYLNHLTTVPNYPNIELVEFVSVALDVTHRTLTKTLIPHNQVIKAKGDISLENVTNIDSFTLTAEQSGDGIVRIATSFDGGITWLGHGDVEIDIDNTEDFLTKGRTVEQFNNYDFNTLNHGTIRNAYLIGIEDINDKAELTKLESQMDYVGALFKQLNDNNIEIGLLNDKIKIKYKNAGDYVFNIIT